MTRINALTLDQAPPAARSALQGVEKGLGFIPNAFATLAHSPAALGGYLALSQALNKNSLSPAEREVVALAASAVNGCDYCIAAHSFFGGKAGLDAGALLAVAREAGLDNAKIVDVIAQVSLLTLTNYLNNAAMTDIDFPPAGT